MGDDVIPAPRPKITRFIGHWVVLSNFYACDVLGVCGWRFQTLEHAFQAAKVDPEHPQAQAWYQRIYKANTPADAKSLGKHCPLRSDWEAVKIDVMRELLRTKFSRPEMRKELLATNDAELIEGNTWNDKFWGMCMGEGENHLGKLLMEIREELKSAKTP